MDTDASDSFVEWVHSNFGSVNRPSPNEFVVDCPNCGAKKRLSLNPIKRVANCYRCGGRRLVHLMEELTGMDSFTCVDIIDGSGCVSLSSQGVLIERLQGIGRRPDPLIESNRKKLAEEITKYFKLVGYGDPFVDGFVEGYLHRRGFNLEVAKLWRLAFAVGGKYSQRLILPVYEEGSMVYFQGRSIRQGDRLRYLNPGASDGLDGRSYVFNLDVAARYIDQPLYICEGAFNAMTIGGNAVALFHKSLSDEQFSRICTKIPRNRKVVICFDHGAEADAGEAGQKLKGAGFSVSVVLPPTESDYNDMYVAFGMSGVRELISQNTVELGGASGAILSLL